MPDLWTKSQLDGVLPLKQIKAMEQAAAVAWSNDPNAGAVKGQWELVQNSCTPGESQCSIWRLRGKTLTVRITNDRLGTIAEQVFHRTRMVPVDEYVTASEFT